MPEPSDLPQQLSLLQPAEAELEGVVDRISFHAEDTGYTVLKLKSQRDDELITVVGELPNLFAGETLRLHGSWSNHPKYGAQFKAERFEKLLPATITGLQRYLASGLIKGVGPVTARRLIRHFGMDLMRVIEEEPERLQEVPLIGKAKREQIVQSWNEHREIQNIMIFLQTHGVSTAYAVKIFKQYGNQALEVVKQNPYRLAEEIWGIGFKIADKLASQLGLSGEHPDRLEAGLLYALQKATSDGHLFLLRHELLWRAAELLEVKTDLLPAALERMGQRDLVILENDPENPDVYVRGLWQAETGAAEKLIGLMEHVEPPDPEKLEAWLTDYQQDVQIEFSAEQLTALRQAAASKMFILTGGPGTGKTTLSRAILDWFEHQGQHMLLASPTGRAAKRLSEVSGREASTIHRLLEFDPRQMAFNRNEYAPLDTDLLLLDEVSMIDTTLFYHLLRALPQQVRLVLVGDSDQLPSVGAGAVLKDLISSGVIPAVELKTIFRQAEASRIVRNAHLVNRGEMPVLLPPRGAHREENAFFIEAGRPEAVIEQVCELVSQRLPKAGHHPATIQVLCPMNRGLLGTQALNQRLQELLNPPSPEKSELLRGQRILRAGDRVMQLRNNYDRDVFNGDLGEVLRIDGEDQQLVVQFPDKAVTYDLSDTDELALAYALTIHKSQGSEFPVVVMPLAQQHYMMLQRNLFYTGMTRAKKLLIVVGQRRAIEMAVNNHKLVERRTRLAERLQEQLEQVQEQSED